MDPIMKLLEDDEDESLHSGADVEAFTAALNREVEASTSVPAGSSSQPTDHGARFLPQEHKSLLNHGHGQWQDPVKNEIVNQETQQQEQTHALTNDHPSRPEMVSQGSNNNPFPTNTPKERYLLKAKQDPGTTSQQGIVAQQQPMQQMKCEQTPIVTQQQSMHQMKSQQTPGTNQTNSATTTAKAPVVPFHMLFPILRPYLDKGRDMQVQSIFAKLRKNEVSKEHFLKVVRNIVGDKLLKQAASQYQMQIQFSAQAPPAAASQTPQRKAPSGQKKPLEALGSSLPPSSKKQKVYGGFHEQSFDQLNDVTAVSGVNLREEEEQLFSAPKEESQVSEAAQKVVQLEEEKLILRKGPLSQKLAGIMSKCNLKVIGTDVERCLSMCVEERLRGFISSIIRFSKQRVDVEKSRHRFYPLSSDVRSHIMRVNREAREQWEKKQAEDADRIRKQNDGDGNANVDLEKEKNETRGLSKHAKTYKEDDDKMRTTAANIAARVAAGGDDMLSKWQLLAERNKQRSEGGDGSSGSVPGNMLQHRLSQRPGKDLREEQEVEKRGYSTMFGSDHCPLLLGWREFSMGKRRFHFESFWPELDGFLVMVQQSWEQPTVAVCPLQCLADKLQRLAKDLQSWSHRKTGGVRRSPLTKVARSVSIKDVVAALEREPQMSKSSLLFWLYGRPLTEPSAK